MRLAIAVLALLLALSPIEGKAFVMPAPGLSATPNVTAVSGGCGRYAHYVPSHRNHWGHWIRGHCERNGGWRG
jgi:hypothetical protein